MIGNVLKTRQSTAVKLAIDPKNPYGVVSGMATKWITRDRTCLYIASMGDRHIINTINLIERGREARRKNEDGAWDFFAICRGEMATYYASHMADDAWLESLSYELLVAPILAGLRFESNKRGLAEVIQKPRTNH